MTHGCPKCAVLTDMGIDPSLEIGDLVETANAQRGIVCSVDPPVMRTVPFVSYVPLSECRIKEKGVDRECAISDAVLGRIKKYLENEARATPTGELA